MAPRRAAYPGTPPETLATMAPSALLAQLVEHLHGKEGVVGSSPTEGFAEVLPIPLACPSRSQLSPPALPGFTCVSLVRAHRQAGFGLFSRSPPGGPLCTEGGAAQERPGARGADGRRCTARRGGSSSLRDLLSCAREAAYTEAVADSSGLHRQAGHRSPGQLPHRGPCIAGAGSGPSRETPPWCRCRQSTSTFAKTCQARRLFATRLNQRYQRSP